MADGPHRVLYFWHSVGNKCLTILSNMFTNFNLTDMESGYKVFRREVIQSIQLQEDRFGFEPEVTAKVARGGWRVYEVGISYSGRTYEEGKKVGWRDGVSAAWCILKYGVETLTARANLVAVGGPWRLQERRSAPGFGDAVHDDWPRALAWSAASHRRASGGHPPRRCPRARSAWSTTVRTPSDRTNSTEAASGNPTTPWCMSSNDCGEKPL